MHKLNISYSKKPVISGKTLTQEQKHLITTDEPRLLVVSTAGSGKTFVLTERVVHKIQQGVPQKNILLLTFTNKAGREMIQRINTRLGNNVSITYGTFHSFAYRMLRKYGDVESNFSTLDGSEAITVWEKANNGSKKFRKCYELMRNKGLSKKQALTMAFPNLMYDSAKLGMYKEQLNACIKRYTNFKNKYALLDFDDMIERFETFLHSDKVFRAKVSTYSHVFIDEVQDCNNQQFNIIKGLELGNSERNNYMDLFAVGDNAQSIYGFRGADFRNMERFPEIFDAKVYMMVTNFRSSVEILNFANEVGRHFTSTKWKKEMIGTYHGHKPYYVYAKDSYDQTRFVLSEIQKLLDKGITPREIGILYRVNSSAVQLELALTKSQIQYEKYGGVGFLDQAHIKDILAYFRAAFFARDILGYERILSLIPKIGKVTSQKIYTCAFEYDLGIKYLLNHDNSDIKELGKVLMYVHKHNDDVTVCYDKVWDYCRPYLELRYPDDWERRKSSILEFIKLMGQYKSCHQMLSDLGLNGATLVKKESQDKILLSTVHSVKGLEMDTVFIIDMYERRFPNYFLLYDGEIPRNTAAHPIDPDKLDEDRRLFYVACTRAKTNLIIVNPSGRESYDKFYTGHTNDSCFIREMEDLESLCDIRLTPACADEGEK